MKTLSAAVIRWKAIDLAVSLCALLAGALVLPSCRLAHRHRNTEMAGPVNPGDQPDKILFQKASREIEHGRYDVGRLTLQTLINTYPDSEYLSKAKLAIADSYYREGGVSGLTQAEAEYKDFITFFPTAPEAPDAQYRAGMAHFRMMAKADRDRGEAKLAEREFKEFLLKYPDSPLMPRVKGRLREVQEVLGEGDFKIAEFYFKKGANRAARSRFQEIVDKYPNFSRADEALWSLGQSLERLKQPKEAVPYYGRILTQFPLSSFTDDAKARLTAMHQPVPKPTSAMLARAEADAVHRQKRDLLAKFGGAMSSSPDFTATRHGPVELSPQKTSEVQVASNSGEAGAMASNTVSARTVGEEALKSGKPIDPGGNTPAAVSGNGQPPADPSAASAQTQQQNQEASSSSGSQDAQHAKKKKSIFKKILRPF